MANPTHFARLCGARARTTGQPCRGLAVTGSPRCRMHGGKGSGAPVKHGAYTKEAKAARAERRRARGLMRLLGLLLDDEMPSADELREVFTEEQLREALGDAWPPK